jgi:2-polyprenyl-6-methoxyphenol hydroxylase-like FAD-dependent oxidoreductase
MIDIVNMYDVVIVGAGISGLYAAYKIKRDAPTTSLLILEKNPRNRIGGRMGVEMFYDTPLTIGAGIGREDKNPKLIQLCKDLGVDLAPGNKSPVDYSADIISRVPNPRVFYLDTIKVLRREYRKDPVINTFRQFATRVLGQKMYKQFVEVSGYSDYEDADVYETLYNYSMDDNTGGWPKLFIPWTELLDKLVAKIGAQNIRTSANVYGIRNVGGASYEILLEGQIKTLECRNIIVATTIDTVKRLFPEKQAIYNHIRGQPFLRVYAKFDKKSAAIMREHVHRYTIVSGPLQKIIPMNPEEGVYMVAYSDNASAEMLKGKSKQVFCDLLEKSLGIPAGSLHIIGLKEYYWSIGTHYFTPMARSQRKRFLYEAQNPMAGVFVVGEAFSTYQGWVEGALESVDAILSAKPRNI